MCLILFNFFPWIFIFNLCHNDSNEIDFYYFSTHSLGVRNRKCISKTLPDCIEDAKLDSLNALRRQLLNQYSLGDAEGFLEPESKFNYSIWESPFKESHRLIYSMIHFQLSRL